MARNLPFEEQVRVRAYEIFLARGAAGGDPEQDWLQAEEEVRRLQGNEPIPGDALEEAETRPGPSAGTPPPPRRPSRTKTTPAARRQ